MLKVVKSTCAGGWRGHFKREREGEKRDWITNTCIHITRKRSKNQLKKKKKTERERKKRDWISESQTHVYTHVKSYVSGWESSLTMVP